MCPASCGKASGSSDSANLKKPKATAGTAPKMLPTKAARVPHPASRSSSMFITSFFGATGDPMGNRLSTVFQLSLKSASERSVIASWKFIQEVVWVG